MNITADKMIIKSGRKEPEIKANGNKYNIVLKKEWLKEYIN